jgi:hypothetical protein
LDLCERLGLAEELAHVVAQIKAQRGKLPPRLARRMAGFKNAQLELQN